MTVFVEERDTLELEGMMAVVEIRKVGSNGSRTSGPPAIHDAGDNLILILACPPAWIQSPSFISPNSTTPAPIRILAQQRR